MKGLLQSYFTPGWITNDGPPGNELSEPGDSTLASNRVMSWFSDKRFITLFLCSSFLLFALKATTCSDDIIAPATISVECQPAAAPSVS